VSLKWPIKGLEELRGGHAGDTLLATCYLHQVPHQIHADRQPASPNNKEQMRFQSKILAPAEHALNLSNLPPKVTLDGAHK
jgi:hypothetical protein